MGAFSMITNLRVDFRLKVCLAGGEHGQQPAGEEVGVSGDQLGDAAARLTSGRAPGADQLQVQPVHCQDQHLGVAVVYCSVLRCTVLYCTVLY